MRQPHEKHPRPEPDRDPPRDKHTAEEEDRARKPDGEGDDDLFDDVPV